MAGTIMPAPKHQFFDNNGLPASSHKLFCYTAGSSVKQTTYSDSALSSANANPLPLDSSGRATIFLPPNTSWKFLLCPNSDTDPPVSPLWTVDNVQNVPTGTINVDIDGTAGETIAAGDCVYLSDGSGSLTAGRWYKATASNSYSSSQAGSIGFAIAAIASGSSGSIRIQGRMTGLAGLTAGTIYYVSATAGALTSTAPGNAAIVGQADSSTSLVLSARAGATSALTQMVGNVNLLADPTFLIWAAGDAAVPTHYTTSGAGSTIARAGTGLADTNRKVGDFCLKVTTGLNQVIVQQQLLPTAAFTKANFLRGQTVSVGCWVRTSTRTTAFSIRIYDGVGTSVSGNPTALNTWSWVTVSRTLDVAATELTFQMTSETSSEIGYFSGPTFVLGPIAPAYYQPTRSHYETVRYFLSGAQTASTDKERQMFARAAIVKDVQLNIGTAPTGSSLIVDVRSWDGAAFTTMFTGGARPTIAIAASLGGSQPDGTYARRCLAPYVGSTFAALSWDVAQIGSGTAGSNLWVYVRCLVYDRPLEEFLAYNDIT